MLWHSSKYGLSDRVLPDSSLSCIPCYIEYTVDPRYLDLDYLEYPLISKRKSDPCFNIEI